MKQLDRNGLQGNREFLVEVLMLSLLHHENLVNLIGYCADGDQRLLVYEYMPRGSLEDHLLGTIYFHRIRYALSDCPNFFKNFFKFQEIWFQNKPLICSYAPIQMWRQTKSH